MHEQKYVRSVFSVLIVQIGYDITFLLSALEPSNTHKHFDMARFVLSGHKMAMREARRLTAGTKISSHKSSDEIGMGEGGVVRTERNPDQLLDHEAKPTTGPRFMSHDYINKMRRKHQHGIKRRHMCPT